MEFLPFFLIVLASVLFSFVFRRFHLPWVLALITGGVFVGPHGLDLVQLNPTITFMSQIGLIFLMFMAGLETKLSSFKHFTKSLVTLPIINAMVPFAVGYAIGIFFGMEMISSLLLGIIFMSSSISVIVPTLEATGLMYTKLGRSIVSTIMIEDIASLVLLSILLQSINPTTALPLPSFYFLLTILLISLAYGLPKIRNLIPHRRDEKDLFESEVRIIFALLLGTVITFEFLGLHPIIAGFFAGLVLSDSIRSEILIEKLRTLSYGIFIPVFFVVIGMKTDISVFQNGQGEIALILAVIIGSIGSKLASGWFGARIAGFKNKEALIFGFATTPQLSTTFAVVFTGLTLGLIETKLVAAMVMHSIISILISPLALYYFQKKK
ncbi:MAG: cation:proton antiporter [bacterium]|nr:cation:proton antiporter [bacterium]